MNSLTLKTMKLRGQFHKNRNAYIAAQEPAVFHCHHYNTFLQAAIEDTSSYLDVHPILVESSQEIAYAQFARFFKEEKLATDERKEVVEDYFRFCGFGKIDLSTLDHLGGVTHTTSDHYGVGWKSKFGLRHEDDMGVSFFTLGYIIGALEAIYDLKLGSLSGKQTACIAKGHERSTFEIVDRQTKGLKNSPEEGIFQIGKLPQTDTQVDYEGIREALINMPLEGDSENGMIEAFDVLLTRMYSNYYCLVSYKFLNLFEEKLGADGLNMAKELLTEAGHVCAFNTLGGVMQSAEWNGLIKPMLQSKDDWVHGILAVINSLGWGFWEALEFIPNEKLVIQIRSGYEANNFVKQFGKSEVPISFLATGGVAGIMNLIYNTSITEESITLDETLYNQLRNRADVFSGTQLECRAMGEWCDSFEATRQ